MADKKLMDDVEWPSWYDGKKIDEVAFCYSFLKLHPMICVRGRLFTMNGLIEDEGEIQQKILDEIMTCQTTGISKTVIELLRRNHVLDGLSETNQFSMF